MHIVTDQVALHTVCNQLSQEPVMFIDTEFCRRTTYYATLSTVQIAASRHRIIIDVLSDIDLAPFQELLLNPDILKVLHAPDQDLAIFYHVFGALPQNIFDTQIAAGVIGMNAVSSYSALCKSILNINVDKKMQNSNWLQRPLGSALINYAIKDVEYLIPLYRELVRSIDHRNLWDTYHARSDKLLDVKSYQASPEKIMRKMNMYNQSEFFKRKMIYFIELREECAKFLNIPRNFCAKDHELIQLCNILPVHDREIDLLHIKRSPLVKHRKFRSKLLDLCIGLKHCRDDLQLGQN